MAKVIAENDIAIFSFPVVIIRWLSAPEAPDLWTLRLEALP